MIMKTPSYFSNDAAVQQPKMKRKKIIGIIFILIFCLTCIGTASAWYSNTEADVAPSDSLNVGQTVFATMEVIMARDSISTSDYLYLRTPLDSAQWVVDIKYRNSDIPLSSKSGNGKLMQISGFELSYNDDILITIALTGIVPVSSEGYTLSVLSLEQYPARSTSSTSWTVTDPVITPSGSLYRGQSISATREVIIPSGGIRTSESLNLATILDSAQWNIITKYRYSDTPISSKTGSGSLLSMSGFELGYNDDIKVVIDLTGTVPNTYDGNSDNILHVENHRANQNQFEYTSPEQDVWGPNVPSSTQTTSPTYTQASTRIPEIPAQYHGTATINGNPLPAGIEITAKSGSTSVGTITTTESGKIGGPGAFDEKLIVSLPDESSSDTITFWIATLQANQTATYVSGTSEEINFTFFGTIPTSTPTYTATNPGGGGNIGSSGSSSGGSAGSSSAAVTQTSVKTATQTPASGEESYTSPITIPNLPLSSEEDNSWIFILIIIVVAGIVIGIILIRRRNY